jgi:signal transduction histidine kinase
MYGAGGEDDLVGLFVLISGRFSVRVIQGVVEREIREITPGGITGYLPYSRMTTPRGYLVADGPVEFLLLSPDDTREMTRQCYEFTALCVHEMLDRVRVFKADDKRQEKLAALGRLSAGLAHELNNPASAAARGARELDGARAELGTAARELGEAALGSDASRALRDLEAGVRPGAGDSLSPLDRAEREDELTDWLADRGIDVELGFVLAEAGLTAADLDRAASAFEDGQLGPALRFLAADTVVQRLIADVASAAERIHTLVAAVKKHTHMDRAPVAEPIRLDEHLSDTVTLMRSKAALKGASIELRVENDLPPVEASVSDLNQVWMHLLDNAIDAVAAAGRIVIDARKTEGCVVVRFVDDGHGVPEELTERIFEPFFTTKDVGEGRGLGLDVVRTVVRSHRGTVGLSSAPGRTEFRVTLPGAGSQAADDRVLRPGWT